MASINLTVHMDPVQLDALQQSLVNQVETIKTDRNRRLSALAEAAVRVFMQTELFTFSDELPPSQRDLAEDLRVEIISWLTSTGERAPDPADDPSNAISGK